MKNDLGVDPDEWFIDIKDPPEGDYLPEVDWEDTAPSEYEPSDFADVDWFTNEKPKKEETIHEKMYKIATAKYNPFAVGGSESLGGGSEEAHK